MVSDDTPGSMHMTEHRNAMKNATDTWTTLTAACDAGSGPCQENVRKSSSDGEAPSSGDRPGDKGLRRWARSLYERIPWRLHWVLGPLVYIYTVFNEVRPRFWIAESHDRSGGGAAVLCASQGRNRSYLLHQFLGDAYCERCLGRKWLWDIPKIAAGEGRGCCMVAVSTLGRFRGLLKPGRWLYVPGWVAGDIDLPLSPRVLQTETVRSDLRKIQKKSLQFRVTREIADFDDFYDRMYVPYVAHAHGDSAVIAPHEAMRANFKDCELLLVLQEGNSIAGMLISYSQATPRLCSMGIRDANRDFVRDGAIGALYHFSLRYLQEKGFGKVNLGLSRSFLLDGVLRYKKKLGLRLSRAGKEWFAVRVLEDSEVARRLLRETPVVFESDGALYGAVFADAKADPFSDEDFERLDKQFFMEGLSRLLVVPLGDSSFKAVVPPELAGRIAVCRASDLLV